MFTYFVSIGSSLIMSICCTSISFGTSFSLWSVIGLLLIIASIGCILIASSFLVMIIGCVSTFEIDTSLV
jgi:hypothetical protein